MKTSNKILIGLLIVIFTVPFLFAYSLKSKMNKGIYTVEKNKNSMNKTLRSGSFTKFKVVKVIAPNPELLTCRLTLSEDMNYKYYQNNSKDSMMIFTTNDTLFVEYAPKKVAAENEAREYLRTTVNINLPAFSSLVVDGAVVVIDQMNSSVGNLSVNLLNGGAVRDGSKKGTGQSQPTTATGTLNKEKDLQVAKTGEVEILNVRDKARVGTLENVRSRLLEIDLRNFLIHSLFYKIDFL